MGRNLDIMRDLDLVKRNDPSFTSLKLDPELLDDDIWDLLLQSLKGNTHVQRVRISRVWTDCGIKSHDDLCELFEVLADVPSIRALEMHAILDKDFVAATPLIEGHQINQCHLAWSEGPGLVPLPVAQALARNPALTELYVNDPLPKLASSWLSCLFGSPSLKKIQISNDSANPFDMQFEGEDFKVFQSLRHNKVLEDFSLGFVIDEEVAPYVVEILKGNTCLQRLSLTILPQEEIFHDIIEALATNTNLRKFENHTPCLAQGFSRVFQESRPVHNLGKSLGEKQLELLETNQRLSKLTLFDEDSEFTQEKTKLELLNGAGRSRLFARDADGKSQASTSDWIATMAETSHNLDCLFYCISMNPSICKLEPAQAVSRKRRNGVS